MGGVPEGESRLCSLNDGRAKLGECMGEEEAILESLWEVLETTGIFSGAQETWRSVKASGEVWSFTGKVLGMGVGVEDA